MRKGIGDWVLAIGVVVGLVVAMSGGAMAQDAGRSGGYQVPRSGYDLAWWTVDGGGGTMSGAGYSLAGTAGQPDAGMLSGPGYTLSGGFWPGGLGGRGLYHVYLPLVVRRYPQ